MDKKYDVIAIGMGPSSVFMAYELVQLKKYKKILLIEQGRRVEDRNCPLEKLGKCIKCKPYCNITSGFSGAGAFSDGKLSLYNEEDDDIYVGGYVQEYIGVEETKKLIDYADSIYLKFGADKHLEGVEYKEEVDKLKEKAKKNGLELISIPIRHLGTEKAHDLYKRIEDYLEENGVEMLFNTSVEDIIVEKGAVKGVKTRNVQNDEEAIFKADKVVMAVGRKGANWLVDICEKHDIQTEAGVVDIGVRYELSDEVMKDVNKYMYEGKFVGKPGPFGDKVRTFCQNPSGFVSSEVYDNDLNLVNGHSYKEKKSKNTNLAILVSHHFNHPFDKPIEYGRNVAKNLNELGAGNVVVQRLGDIYRGKRKPKKALLPASVYLDEGKPIWVEAPDSEKEKYSIERVFPTDYESIYKEIGDANNLKEVDPSILESSEDFYAPAIEAGDDTLKKIVKTVLASKSSSICA